MTLCIRYFCLCNSTMSVHSCLLLTRVENQIVCVSYGYTTLPGPSVPGRQFLDRHSNPNPNPDPNPSPNPNPDPNPNPNPIPNPVQELTVQDLTVQELTVQEVSCN